LGGLIQKIEPKALGAFSLVSDHLRRRTKKLMVGSERECTEMIPDEIRREVEEMMREFVKKSVE